MIDPIELKPTSKVNLYKVIRIPAGGRKQIVFNLTDEAGGSIDLAAEPVNEPAGEPKFGVQKQLAAGTVKIRLVAKGDLSDGNAYFDLEGRIIPDGDCKGMVEFLLSAEQTQCPGIYLAEVGRFAGEYLVDVWPCYIAIEPTVYQQLRGHGPVTIPEIRLHLDDVSPGDISLLDANEFEDVQILFAIREIVDLWNETPPPVCTYTVDTFPFRHHWVEGVIAKLYSIRAHKYRRNQLNYQAGGIAIDDQNKSAEYQAIADRMMMEFKAWMMQEKIRQNIERAWSAGL